MTDSLTPAASIVEWQTVPTEITEEMHAAAVRTAARCSGNDDFPPRVYRAMLAAAPTPPAAMPAAPSDAVTDGTSFLIQICGEDIDHPLTAIVPNWEGVRRFCVEHYTGSEDAENLCGNILDTLKNEFDEHEAEETGKPYTEQWEIGGLSIERVCDCTPRAALTQPTTLQQAAGVHALSEVVRLLRKQGHYEDEEGEATNQLADLLDALKGMQPGERKEGE